MDPPNEHKYYNYNYYKVLINYNYYRIYLFLRRCNAEQIYYTTTEHSLHVGEYVVGCTTCTIHKHK